MPQAKGKVILVGGGPGDPGLLTVRGKEALSSADVVLYDRLVGSEILSLIPPDAQSIDVGKHSGLHRVTQPEINNLILRLAQQGKQVVRLKGGDPYLFGRGAEELEAVQEQGIPFEVVPGVTSAIAVPAYGGIPISHRDLSSSIHIVTGHPRHGATSSIAYESLVKLGGTLIFLMGVAALAEIAENLLQAGMEPETAAALVENGTRPQQRKIISTVSCIAQEAATAKFQSPSVLVVGKVCSLSPDLDWFSKRPLFGKRVLVTRPKSAESVLPAKLRSLGCDVIEYPCIRTEPLPLPSSMFASLTQQDWVVFTSPVGAEQFFAELQTRQIDIRTLVGVQFAVVGAKTAARLTDKGIFPAIIPEQYNAEHLAAALTKQGKAGERVLLFRAKIGSPELPAILHANGFIVEDIAAYDTLYEHPDAHSILTYLRQGDVDYVVFTSASTVEAFVQSLPEGCPTSVTAVCIGPDTAAAAQRYGFSVLVSHTATIDSLVERILQNVENDCKNQPS